MVEPKRLTLAQLKEYDGNTKKKPIYLAIRGVVFDVSKGEADTLASRLTLVQILLHGRKEGAADYKSHIHSAVQG